MRLTLGIERGNYGEAKITLLQAQLDVLENVFLHETRYPDVFRREALQQELGVPESRIQVML